MQHHRSSSPFRAYLLGFSLLLFILFGLATGQVEAADERLPPAVEEFRQALLLESRFSRDVKAAIAFREKNLAEKAANLKSIADVARTLTLQEWDTERGTSDPDKVSRWAEIDIKQRRALTNRLQDEVKVIVEKGTNDERMATAYLLGETAATLRKQETGTLDLDVDTRPSEKQRKRRERRLKQADVRDRLAEMANSLIDLTKQKNTDVRKAGAAALGLIEASPSVVAPALGSLLERRNAVDLRLAAAKALNQTVKVAADEHRKSQYLDREPLATYLQVIPVAGRGVTDPDSRVRRECIEAWELLTYAISEAIERVDLGYLPKRELTVDDEIIKDELRRDIRTAKDWMAEMAPIQKAVLGEIAALGEGVNGADPVVRMGTRRTLENLARSREKMMIFPKVLAYEKMLEPKKDVRRAPRRAPGKDTLELVRFEEAQKVDPTDPVLAETLKKLLPELVKGLDDPVVANRLAALATLEALQEGAAPTLPVLIDKGLSDRNRFVRWASARIIGRLAALGIKQTDKSVPRLAKLLFDEDLDLRLAVAVALRRHGTDARAATPSLARMVNRGDSESRVSMLQTLGVIGAPGARDALPEMVKALGVETAVVRAAAANALGQYGPGVAREVPNALELLRKQLEDADGEVRHAASAAILRISGK